MSSVHLLGVNLRIILHVCVSFIFIFIALITAAQSFVIAGIESKNLSVNGIAFYMPKKLSPVLDQLGYLSFTLNVSSLQAEDVKEPLSLLRVNVLPDQDHPGAFFLREEGVKKERCNYKKIGEYMVCEYIDDVRGLVQVFYLKDKIFLANNCTLFEKETSLNRRCHAWAPFLGKLKISYSYPQNYSGNILMLDNAIKYILLNSHEDIQRN